MQRTRLIKARRQALFNWLNKLQGKAIGKGSKSITITQLQAGVAALQLSPPVSKTNERAVLDAIDSDGSGTVEYHELVAFVQEHRSKLPTGGTPPPKAVADAAASLSTPLPRLHRRILFTLDATSTSYPIAAGALAAHARSFVTTTCPSHVSVAIG